MSDSDSLAQTAETSSEVPQKMHYSDAVYKLLCRVQSLWASPSKKEDAQKENSPQPLTPFEAFLGTKMEPAEIEPLIRQAIDLHDAQESLVPWLKALPRRLFDTVAFELNCVKVDQAETREEAVKFFLKDFGYVDKSDRDIPEGVRVARDIVEEAYRKFTDCAADDVSGMLGEGGAIGRAVENTLLILVAFYGQFLMPQVFEDFLRQQEELGGDRSKLEDWWNNTKPKIPLKDIRGHIRNFLVEEQTQMGLFIGILEALNNEIPNHAAWESKFRAAFGRNTIFPAYDASKLSARFNTDSGKEFLDQLKEIKDLRNAINHADKNLKRGKIKSDPVRVREIVQKIADAGIFFFESGGAHRLFPEVILVTNNHQNLRRKWSIKAIDERGNEVGFHISREKLELFVPDCELFCWPQESFSSGPKVTLIRLWRK